MSDSLDQRSYSKPTGWHHAEKRLRTLSEEQEVQEIISHIFTKQSQRNLASFHEENSLLGLRRRNGDSISENQRGDSLLERFAEKQRQSNSDRHRQIHEQAFWDSAKHPRGGFSQNRGWFSPVGSGVQSAPHAATWPSSHIGQFHPSVPISRRGVGLTAMSAAGSFAHALNNASMFSYWSVEPGIDAMPKIWAYELQKRVTKEELSHDDAVNIFNTAVLGANAQNFAPTGGTHSAVHKSATDFLGQAEAVYFARKKRKAKEEGALEQGAYQNSGGRVFPTERNSGLRGFALRSEQEKFFDRGLADGKLPEELRGQAENAGSPRKSHKSHRDDELVDAEAEAALQRAIQRLQKKKK